VSTDDVEAAFALDVLAHVCRQHGWALLIRTNGEPTVPTIGSGGPSSSNIVSLDVVEPANRYRGNRKQRVASGELLVRILVDQPGHLQAAAGEALDVLGRGGKLEERRAA
jgi:hypothetical protein